MQDHPIDRLDVECASATHFLPMQKVFCDKKVKSPLHRGINYYRVQGSNGWLVDKRRRNNGSYVYDTMLLPEEKVRTGLFAYKCLDNVFVIRKEKKVCEDYHPPIIIECGQFISVDAVRQASFGKKEGPYLRLTDGSGWALEKRDSEQIFEEIRVQTGKWRFKITNDIGIRLRRQPIASKKMICQSEKLYECDSIIECDRKIRSLPRGKPNFYRVKDTDGWVFDTCDGNVMMKLVSSRATSSDTTVEMKTDPFNEWSPEFVRGITVGVDCVEELACDHDRCVISFMKRNRNYDKCRAKINIYYSIKAVGVITDSSLQGGKEILHKNCNSKELFEFLCDPILQIRNRVERARNKEERQNNIEKNTDFPRATKEEKVIRQSLLKCQQSMEKLRQQETELLKAVYSLDQQRFIQAQKMKMKELNHEVLSHLKNPPTTSPITNRSLKEEKKEPYSHSGICSFTKGFSKISTENKAIDVKEINIIDQI